MDVRDAQDLLLIIQHEKLEVIPDIFYAVFFLHIDVVIVDIIK